MANSPSEPLDHPSYFNPAALPTISSRQNQSEATPRPPISGSSSSRERLHYDSTNTPQSESRQQETWHDFLCAGEHNPALSNNASTPPRQPDPPGYLDPPFIPTQSRNVAQEHRRPMADRKRRLTTADSPGRSNRPAQNERMDNSTAPTAPTTSGTTITSAIDLTNSPPRPVTRQLPPIPPPTDRRTSEFVLPKWQADAEVTHCPFCKNQFTFFYRKHHCRKCGRVVCASCSPHRITIPRQFIVRPPDPPSAIIDLTGSDGDTSPLSPRNYWGGEEVRVCNPCVPDPNLSPPPQNAFSPAGSPGHYRYTERPTPPRHRNSSATHPPLRPDHGHRSTLSDAAIMTADPRRSLPHDPFRHGHQFTNPSSVRDLWPPTVPPGQAGMFPPRTSSASGSGIGLATSPVPYRSMLDTSAPLPPIPQPARRQIAEEDECPICGSELPPKGPNGDETAREGHISACVRSHEYVPTPPPHPTLNPIENGPHASSSAPSASSSSLPAGSFSSASGSGPLRQRRMTGGRMLVYHATEKDCVGEDQEPTECVICFEEFDEGDEMGRLECLCKFHRTCIRQWWDTKGVGSCPTHQLHD
ncbi:hypothetical protein EG328_006248 [Venturia inaequalis]|uniref:RING-type E3 ubiquitin transferase n=1 Tax=Venturia inaequalis TaxID=5025 RepID=A0A8H3Z522_VENIN|nr:hypothetical protein EG328_006248 [Venturia inaequalis]